MKKPYNGLPFVLSVAERSRSMKAGSLAGMTRAGQGYSLT